MIEDFKWCNSDFSIEVNEIKKDCSASCVIKHGSTTILAYCQIGEWHGFSDGPISFNVDYAERYYAINKIPPGFNKREARNKENDVLISKLIERSLRCTINQAFRFAIDIHCVVLSYSKPSPIESLCVLASSVCMDLAGIPVSLIAGCNIAYNDSWNFGSGKHSLFVAGNHYGVTCVNGSGIDLSTSVIYEGIRDKAFQNICAILDYVSEAIKPYKAKSKNYIAQEYENHSIAVNGKELIEALIDNNITKINELKAAFYGHWNNKGIASYKWKQIIKATICSYMHWNNKRLDNRALNDIRPIEYTLKYLKTHGSCFLKTGAARILSVVTVSAGNEVQVVDGLELEQRKFVVHCNDSVSNKFKKELMYADFVRSAFKHYINEDKFIRVVLEVLSIDGIDGLSVCAASLSLKESGVKLIENIAGISVGAIIDGAGCNFFADLSCTEENLVTDMICKIAGSQKGVTAIQLDSMLEFIPYSILDKALTFAFERLQDIFPLLQFKDDNKPIHHRVEHNKPKHENVALEKKPIEKPVEEDLYFIKLKSNVINGLKEIGDNLAIQIEAKVKLNSNGAILYGEKRFTALSKLLTIAYKDQNKKNLALHYMQTAKITDAECEFMSIDPTNQFSVKLKKQNIPNDLKENDFVVIGKSKTYSFFVKC